MSVVFPGRRSAKEQRDEGRGDEIEILNDGDGEMGRQEMREW